MPAVSSLDCGVSQVISKGAGSPPPSSPSPPSPPSPLSFRKEHVQSTPLAATAAAKLRTRLHLEHSQHWTQWSLLVESTLSRSLDSKERNSGVSSMVLSMGMLGSPVERRG
jgi:hypothetical protein